MKLPWPALVLSILVGLLTNRAQTADSLVLQGRALLSAKDLPNANARFLTSVELSPTHQTANVLYAATRVLAWPYSRPAQNMMDRLGMTQTNRDLYLWTAKIPHDTNGVPIPPNDLSSGEVLDLVRTNLLTELSGALGNLAKVTDTNFLLNLTSNETKMGDVTLDFGDVQILRALLHAGEFFIYSIHSYDLNAQFNALYSMHQRGELTIDQLLANYPRALTYATTNDLSLASNAFGKEQVGVMFGWIVAAHQLGAAAAASGAGLIRTATGTYLGAFVGAGGLCVLAAILALMVGTSRRGRPAEASAAAA